MSTNAHRLACLVRAGLAATYQDAAVGLLLAAGLASVQDELLTLDVAF